MITDGYVTVAQRSEIADGDMMTVEAPDGEPVCLVNFGGRIYALHDSCSHQDFPLSAGDVLADGTIECPLHGARFDLESGAVRASPAVDDVCTYAVRVENDTILLGPRR